MNINRECPECGEIIKSGHVCDVSDINRHEARRAEAAKREERERERQEFIDRAVFTMLPDYEWGYTNEGCAEEIYTRAEALWLEREKRRVHQEG